MMRRIYFTMAMLIALSSGPASAQQMATLHCQGHFYGYPTEIVGRRLFIAYNALDDGEVRFEGRIRNQVGEGVIGYGGYTATAPFGGRVVGSGLDIGVSVLDATGPNGSQMLIYGGAPSLGPPEVIGSFTCSWR